MAITVKDIVDDYNAGELNDDSEIIISDEFNVKTFFVLDSYVNSDKDFKINIV